MVLLASLVTFTLQMCLKITDGELRLKVFKYVYTFSGIIVQYYTKIAGVLSWVAHVFSLTPILNTQKILYFFNPSNNFHVLPIIFETHQLFHL